MPELTGRAKVYAAIIGDLSRAEGLSGRGAAIDRGARFLSFSVRLNDPRQLGKALQLSEALALATRTPVVIARREGGEVLYQFQLPPGLWDSYTRADLRTDREHIGVGLAEGRRQINFAFDPPHAGIFGTTGSGKTETVKSALVGLFTAYQPDELQAIIVDLKGKYADFTNVAHLHGVPIAHDDREIDGVLSFTNSELVRRENNSIFDARRLVIVIDEAEAVFSTKARVQIGAALVKRGREVRMHLLAATQEPHKGYFGKHLARQILGRWVGLVDGPQTSYFITGRPDMKCHQLTGRGDFVCLQPGGLYDRLQVALATRADFDRLPRAEIAPPDLPHSEPLDPDRLPDSDQGPGRRREEVDPEKVAHYLFFQPGNVTQRYAREALGIGKDLHYRHRGFALRTVAEFSRLMEGQVNGR